MARLKFELYLPDLTKQDLIDLVVANDDAESARNNEPGIAPEFVTAIDALRLWLSGDFPNVPEIFEVNVIED